MISQTAMKRHFKVLKRERSGQRPDVQYGKQSIPTLTQSAFRHTESDRIQFFFFFLKGGGSRRRQAPLSDLRLFAKQSPVNDLQWISPNRVEQPLFWCSMDVGSENEIG